MISLFHSGVGTLKNLKYVSNCNFLLGVNSWVAVKQMTVPLFIPFPAGFDPVSANLCELSSVTELQF